MHYARIVQLVGGLRPPSPRLKRSKNAPFVKPLPRLLFDGVCLDALYLMVITTIFGARVVKILRIRVNAEYAVRVIFCGQERRAFLL